LLHFLANNVWGKLSMTVEIEVVLFGPDLPGAGQTATCVVGHGSIHIASQQQSAMFRAMEAKVGGFEHNQLQLCWQHQGKTWLLIAANMAAQAKLIAALPQDEITGLGRWKKSTHSQRFVWKSIIFFLSALAIALFLLIWQYSRVVGWVVDQIPLTTEHRIGQAVLASLSAKSSLLDKGPATDAVKKIGDRLTQGSVYQYQWYVSKDTGINAFALPGGIIVVNAGLLKEIGSADELAAVLAHEIQHVEQRHALRNMANSAGLAAAILLVLGDANTVMMIVAHQISAQYFGRQIESDADIKGVELLHSKNINATGMASFFRKIEAELKSRENMPEWLSSHPDTGNRIKTIEEFIAAHPCVKCESLAWNKATVLLNIDNAGKNSTKEKN